MPNSLSTGNSSPYISVITPTFGRPEKLPQAYKIFSSQDAENTEWIVVDDSEQKSAFMVDIPDLRVRYIYFPERLSTGEKRNVAIDAARGEIIVQFDDDDYYAPRYISTMVGCMLREEADFVKLSSFFLYSKIHKQYGYWELEKKGGIHFVWDNDPVKAVIKFDKDANIKDMHLGYGFSYVFKKKVWEATRFPHIFFGQDTPFINSAISNGFKICLINDNTGVCLHILHEANASKSFPQYIMPERLIYRFFEDLDPAYLR